MRLEPADAHRPSGLASTSLPLYGLPPGYEVARMIGDGQIETSREISRKGERLSRVEWLGLLHGDPFDPPSIQVFSSRPPVLDPAELLRTEVLESRGVEGVVRTQPLGISVDVDGEM